MESKKIDLASLTTEERAALMAELEAQQKADREKREADRKALTEMENDAVAEVLKQVEDVSNAIVMFKRNCIAKMDPLIKMKAELGKAADKQRTFSFKTSDGSAKIEIVYNETTKYDDGIHAGVEFAKQWLTEKAEESEESRMMTSIIEDLLGKSRTGTYDVSNLWAFVQSAEEYDVPLLKAAAESVKKSLYKEMTSVSVKVYRKDELGQMRQLPLSATKA